MKNCSTCFKLFSNSFFQELTKQCDEEIKANTDRFEEIAKELSGRDDRGLDKQVQEVKTEYEKLQQFLKDREKVFGCLLVSIHLKSLQSGFELLP